MSVAPRGADDRRLTLNYHVAPLKPGRYSVKGWFRSSYPQPGLDAESNRVVIGIQPTSADRLRQRVSDLTRDLEVDARRGAAFLGFTGDVAAIPPMVDLLYRRDDGVQVAGLDASWTEIAAQSKHLFWMRSRNEGPVSAWSTSSL